jgi:hypothetical protein
MTRQSLAPSVVLICHEDDPIDAEGIAAWLASTFQLKGIVLLRDPPGATLRKLKAEYRRVGLLRLVDVILFRLLYRWRQATKDATWVEGKVEELRRTYPAALDAIPRLRALHPNSEEVRCFIASLGPDFTLARCKYILKPEIFAIPAQGTYVLHPGICPSYRNAHGCFWALVNRDLTRVGMTLLRVDSGIDTGPIYLQTSYDFDETRESHVVIQHRVVLENLGEIAEVLHALCAHEVEPRAVAGERSRNWGQPWLSGYLHWQRQLRAGAS